MNERCEVMIEQYTGKLEDLLKNSIKKEMNENKKICISFSGGLDCSVLSKTASNYGDIVLYVVGQENSQDLESARISSKILDLPLNEIIIDENDIERAVPELIKILKTRSGLEISIELSLFFICKNVNENLIMTGQGADELFGGYSRYLRMTPFQQDEQMKADANHYLQYTYPQEKKIADSFKKTFSAPYMSSSIIEFLESVPIDFKIQKQERKYLLKVLGRKLGLPKEIVDKPKKAVQYGSGIMNILKGLAKKEGLEIHEYLIKV